MKYYTFYRENNKFEDILKDPIVKKLARTKVTWYQFLMIGIPSENNEQNFSYITLKFGDDIQKPEYKDFTPVAGVDYIPKKDKTKFTKKSQSK